jgi:hypothetical protein
VRQKIFDFRISVHLTNSSETQSEFSGNLCKAVELIRNEREVIYVIYKG